MDSVRPRPIPAIVGPTASGKSDLGMALARHFGGEIINCDSVQVYRRLEIGTAKVPMSWRHLVPHHLIDIVEPTENFTAGEYARRARAVIEEIEARGRLAILVGGTGFYLRALRQPLFESPPTDLELRQRLTRIRERWGTHHLYRMLCRVDPPTAGRLSPNDWSRITRALEYYFQTGRRLSENQIHRPPPPDCARRIVVIALDPPREELYRRINARAEAMFRQGLVDEVKSLLDAGIPPSAKAFGAHGYRRVIQYLQGKISLPQAIELTKQDTRHYAKRQLTWFRREPGVTWFKGFGDDPRIQATVIAFLSETHDLHPADERQNDVEKRSG
ncbi:MAG TPA: tRNA (adenosine(37)-N6)-dimethylallyltransferase MiaA [Blastocatellia bacterium]|nr:tRNA (adenosine(37)-N6)-dimethylallyltransferase MiaA [Blastocatellia bacterium]